MILNATGGGRSGAVLTVSGVVGSTITAAKDGKSFSRTADSSGTAVFKGLESGEWTLTMSSGGETATRTITVTADYAITITFFSATINITYPAGSTCKVMNGTTTLTATDTTGTWSCIVPSAGTWTVTATDGTNTKSESVEITSEGQSESVELSYNTVLIRKGVVQSNAFTVYNGTTKTFGTVGTVFRVALTGNMSAYFDNKIDVSKINSIKIALAGGRVAYNITFGLINTKTSFDPLTGDYGNQNIFNVASVVFNGNPQNVSAETKYIDVSGISGSYYFGVTLSHTGGFTDDVYGGGGFDISDIELIEVT